MDKGSFIFNTKNFSKINWHDYKIYGFALDENENEYDWNIVLQQGEISFNSIGFEIYIRKSPEIINKYSFVLSERGGVPAYFNWH